jgi:hypothetical protein
VYSWPQADLPPEIRAASIAAGSAAAQRLGGPHDCAGRVVDALIEQAATADGLTRIAAEGTTPGSRPTAGSDTPKMYPGLAAEEHRAGASPTSQQAIRGRAPRSNPGTASRDHEPCRPLRRTSMTPNILRHAGHLYLWRRWLRPLGSNLRRPRPWWSRPIRTDGCSMVARMPRYGLAPPGIRSAPRIPAIGQNDSSRHVLA